MSSGRAQSRPEISLQDDQISVQGQPVPVRAALRHDGLGAQLVNSAAERKALAYEHWRSKHNQYAVSPKAYTYGKEEHMDTITSQAVVLVINVTRGTEDQQHHHQKHQIEATHDKPWYCRPNAPACGQAQAPATSMGLVQCLPERT
eukprot:6491925-Amphidinium_carterae.3